MTLQTVFGILVVLYSVSNLASMGLELKLRQTIESLRSAMALAMCTRNASGMFAVFTAFPVQHPGVLVMILLAGPVPAIVTFSLAKLFASRAGTTMAGGAA